MSILFSEGNAAGPGHADLALVELPMADPRSVDLICEIQQVYIGLYGSADSSPMNATEFEPPNGCFLVALDPDGAAVGCIGVRRHDERVGEIKRMFVRPAYRRKGYARGLLVAVENRARSLGYTALVLETGTPQPEAMALYEAHGYRPIPGFGYYECAPRSRSFSREL